MSSLFEPEAGQAGGVGGGANREQSAGVERSLEFRRQSTSARVWHSGLSVSLRVSDKGYRSVSSVCAFLCLLNNRIWTDTDMLPVCHFYSLIFCHFCLRCSGASQSPLRVNAGAGFYRRIVISSQVELSQLLPLFHDILPPSASHSSSGSRR